MTKNQLINQIHSLKIDLKYLKRDLQFRLEGNDVEGIFDFSHNFIHIKK